MKTVTVLLLLLLLTLPAAGQARSDDDPAEQFNMAMSHLLGTQGREKSAATAFRLFQGLAEADFAAAQHMLATLYEKGNGAEQDLAMAWVWYRRAGANGFASSEARALRLEKRMNEAQLDHARAQLPVRAP